MEPDTVQDGGRRRHSGKSLDKTNRLPDGRQLVPADGTAFEVRIGGFLRLGTELTIEVV
jgi:hypothetical protein